jgi:hypothetical protein
MVVCRMGVSSESSMCHFMQSIQWCGGQILCKRLAITHRAPSMFIPANWRSWVLKRAKWWRSVERKARFAYWCSRMIGYLRAALIFPLLDRKRHRLEVLK